MIEHLAWPGAVVVIACFALVLFRDGFSRLVDRIKGAGRDGVTFHPSQEVAKVTPHDVPRIPSVSEQAVSAVVLAREEAISVELQRIPEDQLKIAQLRRALATAVVEGELSRLAYVIFGSQVQLLVDLAGTRGELAITHARTLYDGAVAQYPAWYASRSFEDWLGFITRSNLIAASASGVSLTPYGEEFLKFLVDARLAYTRYG